MRDSPNPSPRLLIVVIFQLLCESFFELALHFFQCVKMFCLPTILIQLYIDMLHHHIHEYGHVRNRWNGHRMLITIEHKNIWIRKHVTTSCSGTKPFYYLWVKGFDVRRRDTIFYSVLFIWPPTRAAPIGRTFASRLRAPKIDPSRLAYSTRLSFQILTQTSARFRCVTSPAPRHRVSSRTILTSEWHLHPPVCTRVNTCFNVAPN